MQVSAAIDKDGDIWTSLEDERWTCLVIPSPGKRSGLYLEFQYGPTSRATRYVGM